MTTALCFYCGSLKHGALNVCRSCGVDSTGDMDLDILFSDHYFSHHTLRQFGEILSKLADEEPVDDLLRVRTFLRYLSTRHPDILQITMPADLQELSDGLLEQIGSPGPVDVEEGEKG